MSRYTGELRGRLSPDERERVVELAERGLNATQIAMRMRRHPGTINFAMHALGVTTLTPRPKRAYMRGGVEVRSFSAEEDAWITALRIQGYSTPEIARIGARRFGHPRSAATIGMRLKMLANLA